MQHTATHCNTLQHTATQCTTKQHTDIHTLGSERGNAAAEHRCSKACNGWFESAYALQCVAVCCSVLQCVAACCSALQCVAASCQKRDLAHLQVHTPCQCDALCCTVFQCIPMYFSVSQFVAVFCRRHTCPTEDPTNHHQRLLLLPPLDAEG